MKNIITSALFIILCIPAISQTGLHIGGMFMPQATWLLNEDLDGGEFTFGTAYGATANFHFSDNFGVGADIIVSNEGQRFVNDGVESTIEVSYLKIPLLIHFNSDPNTSIPFLGEVGIQFSSVTKAKFSVDGEEFDLTDENGKTIDPEDVFDSSNLGAVLAFGPGFFIGDHLMLTTMIRWDLHFNDAFSDLGRTLYGTDDFKETYPMTVGLRFGLKYTIGDGAGYD